MILRFALVLSGNQFGQKIPPPNQSRIAQITNTTRQKLRPLLLLDAKPKAAPIPAISITGHNNNPKKGIKPMSAKTRATSPKTNASIFAMMPICALLSEEASFAMDMAEFLRQKA